MTRLDDLAPAAMFVLEFDQLTAWEKGYTAYMYGEREDHPNIPSSYRPTPDEKDDYERGQLQAVLDAQDADDS